MSDTTSRPRVLLFDVNETLLDLAPIERSVEGLLGDAGSATLWFSTMLHHSLAMTVAGRHAGLMDIGAAALRMLAAERGIELDDAGAKRALEGMTRLPPHDDVAPALRRLQAAGFRLATLTNSSQAGVKAQLDHAGLAGFFERQLSVESVALFKPHVAVYEWAAGEMGAAPADCMLVAAHGWDVAGANWAGLRSAFVARPGQQKFPLADAPDIDVADFAALADALGA